jgi:hypothetical protein
MLSTGTAYIIAHESEKNGIHQLWDGRFKLECFTTETSEFQTIYISGGKKNKLNKIDIVGFKRKTRKGDLGLIEVKDFISLRP